MWMVIIHIQSYLVCPLTPIILKSELPKHLKSLNLKHNEEHGQLQSPMWFCASKSWGTAIIGDTVARLSVSRILDLRHVPQGFLMGNHPKLIISRISKRFATFATNYIHIRGMYIYIYVYYTCDTCPNQAHPEHYKTVCADPSLHACNFQPSWGRRVSVLFAIAKGLKDTNGGLKPLSSKVSLASRAWIGRAS